MCVVSMVMDHYRDKWGPLLPTGPRITGDPLNPLGWPSPSTSGEPNQTSGPLLPNAEPPITDEELREFRMWLKRAREYDRRHNEPDCEMESKRAAIKEIARVLGVDVSFVDEQEGGA